MIRNSVNGICSTFCGEFSLTKAISVLPIPFPVSLSKEVTYHHYPLHKFFLLFLLKILPKHHILLLISSRMILRCKRSICRWCLTTTISEWKTIFLPNSFPFLYTVQLSLQFTIPIVIKIISPSEILTLCIISISISNSRRAISFCTTTALQSLIGFSMVSNLKSKQAINDELLYIIIIICFMRNYSLNFLHQVMHYLTCIPINLLLKCSSS